MVDEIKKQSNYFKLITKETNFKVLRVVLAIGKSGNARILNVPGENLPKIFNRLFDPADAKGQNVLVGGGGDSALETAIATSEYADTVVLSYRKPSFARPKEANLNKLNQLVSENKLNLLMESNVKEIKEEMVVLLDNEKNETEIKNSMVFTLIGRELPVSFFKRSGIKMEGELSLTSKLQFLLLLFVAGVIYFGNSSADFYKHFFGKLDSFGDVVGQLLQEIFGLNIYLIRFNFDNYQTFVFIPLIVYKWGKGAYCGWICSCGALAETVGDDYRTLAPHGSKAKKRENIGQ